MRVTFVAIGASTDRCLVHPGKAHAVLRLEEVGEGRREIGYKRLGARCDGHCADPRRGRRFCQRRLEDFVLQGGRERKERGKGLDVRWGWKRRWDAIEAINAMRRSGDAIWSGRGELVGVCKGWSQGRLSRADKRNRRQERWTDREREREVTEQRRE